MQRSLNETRPTSAFALFEEVVIPLAKGACVFSLSSSSVNFLKSFEEEKREEVLRFLRKTRVNKDHNNVSLLS